MSSQSVTLSTSPVNDVKSDLVLYRCIFSSINVFRLSMGIRTWCQQGASTVSASVLATVYNLRTIMREDNSLNASHAVDHCPHPVHTIIPLGYFEDRGPKMPYPPAP